MSLGTLARTLLGDRWFPVLGRCYRAAFVDLEKVVASLPPLPPGAHLLDIGGGDGDMVNILLHRNPDLDITMIDLGPRLGAFLRPEFRPRVHLHPSTSLRDYASMAHNAPDFVLVSDVVHHVPPRERSAFFADVQLVLAGRPTTLIVKDVEPRGLRSWLSACADRYISGDRGVSLVGQNDVMELVKKTFPEAEVQPTNLYDVDRPNYALVFRIPGKK